MANLLLGNTDNHAKNHALLYTGPRPKLAPAYDIFPTMIDAEVTHQLAFDIGAAKMTDDITAGDLEKLVLDLGFPRFAPAQKRRALSLIRSAVGHIDDLQGPGRKMIGDAIAEQSRQLAHALGLSVKIEPPRVYRRAELSETCPLWNRHKRRRPRSRIPLSSANARCGW